MTLLLREMIYNFEFIFDHEYRAKQKVGWCHRQSQQNPYKGPLKFRTEYRMDRHPQLADKRGGAAYRLPLAFHRRQDPALEAFEPMHEPHPAGEGARDGFGDPPAFVPEHAGERGWERQRLYQIVR